MSVDRPSEPQLTLFRRRLGTALDELGVTRAELGSRLGGKSSQYVSQLLTGASRPSTQRIREIEDALGLRAGQLTQALDAGPISGQWSVTPVRRLEDIRSIVGGAQRLHEAGRLATARLLLEDGLGSALSLRRLGPEAAELCAEALLVRARARRQGGEGTLASQDAETALQFVESMPAASASLRARALFWCACCLHNLNVPSGVSALAGKAFPDGLPPDLAYLPDVVRTLLPRDHRGAPPEVLARVADAMARVPYTPEKAIALVVLQMAHPRGAEFCAQLIDEARAAGDRPALAEGLYHHILRAVMGGAIPDGLARLPEAVVAAKEAEFESGLDHILDVACQLLRPPLIRHAEGQGLGAEALRSSVCAPLLEHAREIGRDPRWPGRCRAWAHCAALHSACHLGMPREVREEADVLADPAGVAMPPLARALELLWAYATAERVGLEAGNLADAARAFIDSAEASPDWDAAGTVMGELALAACEVLGDADRAVALARQSAAERPIDAWRWALLARCCRESGDYVAAVSAARRAWELDRYVEPALCYQQAPLYRFPVAREGRRLAARQQARSWIADALRVDAAGAWLAQSTRDEARRMLEWLAADPPRD